MFKGAKPDTGAGSLWSDEDTRTMREMWKAGATARMIGNALGRSRNAVLGHIHRKGYNHMARAVPQAPVVRTPIVREPTPVKTKAESVPGLQAAPEREPYSGPRLWLTRRSYECQFPVSGDGADIMSCCKPIKTFHGYCKACSKRMYVPRKPRVRAPRA